MEEATKKFSSDLADALKNAKVESEKELGAERERMSTVSCSTETLANVFFVSSLVFFI
jgi:hypothetical protein